MALKFKEPPASNVGPGSTKWANILGELRQNPGKWAVVEERAASAAPAYAIRKGRYGGAVSGEFEATSRFNKETGYFEIFARYAAE